MKSVDKIRFSEINGRKEYFVDSYIVKNSQVGRALFEPPRFNFGGRSVQKTCNERQKLVYLRLICNDVECCMSEDIG